MLEKYRRKIYRKALLAALGMTRAFNKADINIPSRWQGLFNALQSLSGFIYSTLSMLDEETDKELQELETRFERSYGDEKFYSEDEIEKINSQFNQIQL